MFENWLLEELELRERTRQPSREEMFRLEALAWRRGRRAVIAGFLVRIGMWLDRPAAMTAVPLDELDECREPAVGY